MNKEKIIITLAVILLFGILVIDTVIEKWDDDRIKQSQPLFEV